MTQPHIGIMARTRSLRSADGRGWESSRRRALSWSSRGLAAAGAALILASAAIHLYLWADGYRHIATVGPLFLAQGIVSIPVALAVVGMRRALVLLAGAALLVATAFGLLLSSWVALFGYQESLAVPYAGMSLVIEFGGAAVLVAAAALTTWR